MDTARLVRVLCAFLLAAAMQPFITTVGQAGVRCLGQPATKVGGPGNNRMYGTPARDVMVGGHGHDFIAGLGGDDLFCGGAGSDIVFAGPGRDRTDGGTGFDLVSWNTPTAHGVRASLGKRRAIGEGLDTWRGIEGFAGSPGRDRLVGSPRDDLILGIGGADRIEGGQGDDLITGNEGPDKLFGGPGRDCASYYFSDQRVWANLAKGKARGDGIDRLFSFTGLEGIPQSEYVFDGDVLIGDGADNFFFGLAGDDWILGGGGNDYVNGGYGADSAAGQSGDDVVIGGAAGDDLGHSGSDDLGGTGEPFSEPGSDFLIGGSYRHFRGYETYDGSDQLHGGSGPDLLRGGPGDDAIYGDEGEDLSDYSVAPEGVTLRFERPYINDDDGSGSRDTLLVEGAVGSRFDDLIVGENQANIFYGLAGDDQIEGADGDDFLNGGDDTDDLDGGLGIDTCKKGESTFMCELPPPVIDVPDFSASFARLKSFRTATTSFSKGRLSRHFLGWPMLEAPIR